MNPKAVTTFALIYGIVFLAVGIAGFVPGLVTPPAADSQAAQGVAAEGMFGQLLGLFPVNWLHNLVHVAFGIWGVAVFRRYGAARFYAQAVAVVYAIFAIMGFIPALQTTFGLIPLYGHDIWLHILLAAVAAIFGFAPVRKPATASDSRPRA